MPMYIPEWEMEEVLARNPELLGFPSKELRLVERQKYLEKSGRYIDLLFKRGDVYLIVEVKSTFVDDDSVIPDQLIPYKKTFAREFGISEDKIECILISPNGFSENVKKLCQEAGILTRTLEKERLTDALRGLNYACKTSLTGIKREIGFLPKKARDELSEQELASLFFKISKNAPIMAHEVGTKHKGQLTTNRDMWFWLFYSVMDRRANAATFVKAKEALEKERLFTPYRIVEQIKTKSERTILNKIANILEDYSFPLLNDNAMGKLAFPKSIVDAARFMSHHSYDFMRLYETYVKTRQGNLREARDSVWRDLQENIYGVGPRIASQIIRGLVLKGPWRFPLNDNRFLEKCRFNVWIAGETRLGLIKDESEYYEQLGRFADGFLKGNRGIIAHVLWYIRKRYCNRPPKCNKCTLNNHCLRASSFLKVKK
jgi:hypothetical protein